MRILSLLFLIFQFNTNCYSQYFKNAKYFIDFEFNAYVHDSVELVSMNDSIENYKVYRIFTKKKQILNSISIRKFKSKLYLKLDNNLDSNYKLFFDLNIKINDSIYMPKYDQYEYYFNKSNQISTDSILVTLESKNIFNFYGRNRSVKILKFSSQNGMIFIDSIGFNSFGLNTFHKLPIDLLYVCSDNKIECNLYSNSNISCNVDSFNKYFTELPYLKAEKNIKMIYQQTLDKISFEGISEYTKMEIFNTFGQLIPSQFYFSNKNEISLVTLPNGMYSIVLRDGSKGYIGSYKVIVCH